MGTPAARGLHDQVAQLRCTVRLGANQGKDKFMVRFVEARRVDDVRFLHCVDQLEQGDSGGL